MVWLASLAAIGSVALLRLSWARRKRSHALNAAGWGLMLLAVVLGWLGAGAWGTTVASMAGIGASLALLAHAGLTSPAATARASDRRAGMLPEAGEPLRLARRIATFMIVVFMAFVAGVGIALGIRSLALALGSGEADAIALAFFTMPLAWTLLAFYVLMERRRTRQLAVLVVAALAATPAFLTGGIA